MNKTPHEYYEKHASKIRNIRVHTDTYDQHTGTYEYQTNRFEILNTNVFLVNTLIVSHANIFHTSKLIPGSGEGVRGRFDGPQRLFSHSEFTLTRKPLTCSTS